MGIAERYRKVAAEVADVARAAGRNPQEVRLVAVSKTVGEEGVAEAFSAGARDFGENRPDQIVPKAQAFPEARWHFIGNIQSRRIPDIVGSAALIHSLYQQRHAEKIDKAAAELGKVQDVLIEVNVSGEASKSGAAPDEALALVRACAALPHVRVCGLMTMAPQGSQSEARRTFEGLASLAVQIRASLPFDEAAAFTELSMGMSEDWPCAIECGATIVRIGRAIFSDSFQE
ncbi:YggS family pyridoxal phosphate-dependent enzyme [uncultured Adlercreutzia sp.]|uniref:YggS family pyridoxal phosphate-dependent enzyme n=1 Tax=uncultured Adlercreutzia sp. TaxID=875803 RepID=UPI0025EF08AE|nr:YggS family pyridoxal phosphate-dependent enzyme [uncultured Adlercreutzia sp.]MCI9261944.1 YggS family pyridoxal phosphate-dependent enzyme [Eggerthellaceae bacterium]